MNDMITMDQLRPKQSAYIRSIGAAVPFGIIYWIWADAEDRGYAP